MTSCIAAPMRIRWDKPDVYQTDVSGYIGSKQSIFYLKVYCAIDFATIGFRVMPENRLLHQFDHRNEKTLEEYMQAAQRLWDEMWFSLSDYDFSTTNTPAP